ncbi:unnamed protein product [Tilletia controversa]|uniref:Trafficking protein particle complex subunit n=3 Tax=Tilletia TaxID=13289 RepID=A0A8X7MUV4_9BASI|nr:hypothetical protein CF336_g1513 [Tilletia laevis]KAE8202020.1 hypothetical protein CF328_g2459 [Tilletia controversa]KAE8264131.1 hypothetical protein A4X03_0g1167 [Tilletia caries]KAE8206540.1 hypothetical protein CF335_g1808 [Tilletia laevis]KAE8249946.1 hypothetical protein A4X06_0g2998 [Tilletia controversa]
MVNTKAFLLCLTLVSLPTNADLGIYERRDVLHERQHGFSVIYEGVKATVAMAALYGLLYTVDVKYEKMAHSQHSRSTFDSDRLLTPHGTDALDLFRGSHDHVIVVLRAFDEPTRIHADSPVAERALSAQTAKELVAMFKGMQLAAAITAVPLAIWKGSHS